MPLPLEQRLATELSVRPQQVLATIALLDEGATVPFIARYRKEVTGNLDDTQLRHLDERLTYLRELDARRQAILDSITEQGKLTPDLAKRIDEADSKQRLEDLPVRTLELLDRREQLDHVRTLPLDELARGALTGHRRERGGEGRCLPPPPALPARARCRSRRR